MRTLIEVVAGLAILANAVIYGTDVFGAIVLRPAIAAVDDRTFTRLMGHVHRVADRRFPAISIGGMIAAVAMAALAAASGHWVSTAAAAVATVALIIFAAIYNLVSKPINAALTARQSPTGSRMTLVSSRPAGTRSSTCASHCRLSRSPHCA
jgi:hypothetical protein